MKRFLAKCLIGLLLLTSGGLDSFARTPHGFGYGAVIPPPTSNLPDAPVTYYNNAATDSSLPNSVPYFNWLGNFNFVELVYFPGATVGGGAYTYNTYMAAIKSAAAAQGNTFSRTGKYINSTRAATTYSGMTAALSATLSAGQPFALMSGPGAFPGGSQVPDNTFIVLNMADTAPVSTVSGGASGWTHGLNAATGEAALEWNTAINGTGAAVNQPNSDLCPNCDFIFHDNINWATIFAGEYQGTSTVYPVEGNGGSNNPVIAPHLQQGYNNFLTAWRGFGLPAGRSVAIRHEGNANWIADQMANGQGPTVYTPAQGLFDMPFAEAGLGSVGYAVMGYRSPARFFQLMQIEEQLRSTDVEAVNVFNSEGGGPFVGTAWPASQSNWTNSVTGQSAMPTNFGTGVATNASSSTHTFSGNYWQAVRYSFGFAFMRSWAWDLDNIPFSGGAGQSWIDELNKSSGIGGGHYNWMGAGSGVPFASTVQTLPVSGGSLNGVYVRVMPNCTGYLNPIGNGTITYTLQSGDMKHALPNGGFSDPAVNNGTLLTVLTLNDGDFRILVP